MLGARWLAGLLACLAVVASPTTCGTTSASMAFSACSRTGLTDESCVLAGDAGPSLTVAISAGTLSPVFTPSTLSYGVVPSVTSLGVPFTVTATFACGYAVSVNGATVGSGVASLPIALNLQTPTPVDVNVTPLSGPDVHYTIVVPAVQEAYAKASNTQTIQGDHPFLGESVALDGDTLAVGSYGESSNATGINGNQTQSSTFQTGAVYVFTRSGTVWSQQAYVKASNARANASFGYSVALSGDTLVVGSSDESSAATGINGNQADTSAYGAGAAYVFTRNGTTWSQQAYVKASNTRANASFGYSVALSGDTLVVGSSDESSAATGINGNQADTSAPYAGAVYVFTRSGTVWSQQAYVKASNRANANFGRSVALSGDTIAVGSWLEPSNATGINGDQADTSAPGAGAVYVFARSGTTWMQQAYVKASNTRAGAAFGSVALSGDTLAVGSSDESSAATGINGNQADTSAPYAGAVYVFTRSGTTWMQQAYVKASNTRTLAAFGCPNSVALSGDTLAVGSWRETSNATGINGKQSDISAPGAGAVYVFTRSGTAWSQQAYVKASNTRADALFHSVTLTRDTLAVGSPGESSNATGINGSEADTSAFSAGAVYVLR